jgi:hypothetical protein
MKFFGSLSGDPKTDKHRPLGIHSAGKSEKIYKNPD